MKLITRNGELDLPQDFSMTMERTNPLLSGEGDASVPTSLPASSNNLSTLGHLERIDLANQRNNKMDAILQVGPVQKRGQIVIDTIDPEEGIDASFAIDSSDLYVKAKEKSLKTIFKEKNMEGVSKKTWQSLSAAMTAMQAVYDGDDTQDYTIFPVSIAPYDDNGTKVYQYNNEVDASGHLVYSARMVREGEWHMHVTEGYGIAPFLKLHKMLDRLFECLEYTVTENCFDDSEGLDVLANLTLVHNCADALVRPVLEYADLVPSCSLSDFLNWLLAKFHVQPVVDSETKTVKIVSMETMLAANTDLDISGKVEGRWKMQLNPSKRIVLIPNGASDEENKKEEESDDDSLQALAKAAARTLNGLMKQYSTYVELDEVGWESLSGQNPVVYDCLVLRKTTGEFYIINRNLQTGERVMKRLGTNHFVYDRYNSKEKEEWQQDDLIPLMRVDSSVKGGVSPYIGGRIHFHTSGESAEGDEKQEIILCQRAYNSRFIFKTTGTTQSYVPFSSPLSGVNGQDLGLGLTNYEMYEPFWQRWNNLLLNHATHLSGRVDYSLAQFIQLDMSRPKLCDGQRLLPEKASAQLSDRFGLTEVEMIIAKTYTDGVSDSPIAPSQSNGLMWLLCIDGVEDLVERVWGNAVELWENTNYPTQDAVKESYSVIISDITGTEHLGVPTYEGQVVDMGNHSIEITVSGKVKYYDGYGDLQEATISDYVEICSNVHCWFEAVTA